MKPARAPGGKPYLGIRAEHAADTRRRIERAALELFVEKGVDGTTVRHLADRTRLSLGAMYNHFKGGMDEIARFLFDQLWSEFASELRNRAHQGKTISDKLRSMIAYVFRRFDEDSVPVTYVFFRRHAYLKTLSVTRHNPYLVFRLVIAEAMRRGEIPRTDTDLATSLVIGSIIQAIDSRILGRLTGDLERYAESAALMCLRTLGAPTKS